MSASTSIGHLQLDHSLGGMSNEQVNTRKAYISLLSTLKNSPSNYSLQIGDVPPVLHEVAPGASSAVLRFRDLRSCSTVKSGRLRDFAQAYISGELECSGDTNAILDVFDSLKDDPQTAFESLAQIPLAFGDWISEHFPSLIPAKKHYSLSPAAYELFLDKHMQYTCARYDKAETLEQAQVEKFELIKKWAGRTDRLLDVGCGWGGLIAYFAQNYGSKCVGLSDCHEHIRYIQKRWSSLSSNFKLLPGDFSNLNRQSGSYDLITVVGMLEHLRPNRQIRLLKTLHNLLSDNGCVYLQCIVKASEWIGGDGSRFLQKHVFPGYYIDYPAKVLHRIKAAGFSVEESRPDDAMDYSSTTLAWAKRLESNRSQFCQLLDEEQYRIFYGYLLMASRLFATSRGQLARFALRKS